MVTNTTKKQGYWRTNPATGEREWIESNFQPKKPELEEDIPTRVRTSVRFGTTPHEAETQWEDWWKKYQKSGVMPAAPTEERWQPYYEQFTGAATAWEQTPEAIEYRKYQYQIEAETKQYQADLQALTPFLKHGGYDIGAAREAGVSQDILQRVFGEQLKQIDIQPSYVTDWPQLTAGLPGLPEDYELLYKEYQRTGGKLQPELWTAIGAPLRPELEERLQTIYPEKFPQGYIMEELFPVVVEQLNAQIQGDLQGFINDLYGRVGKEDGDILLRQLGYTEDSILPLLSSEMQEERVLQTIQAVFPEYNSIDDFEKLLESDPEIVIETLQWQGRTTETENLLSALGKTSAWIDEFYPQPLYQPPLYQPPTFESWSVEKGFEREEYADMLREKGMPEEDIPEGVERAWNELKAIYEYETNQGRYATVLGGLEKAILSEPATLREAAKIFGKSLTKFPRQMQASILQAVQGMEGARVKDENDRLIDEANTDMQKFTQEIAQKYPDKQWLTDIAGVSQNLAFSITSMGAGAAVGVPIALLPIPGARVAAWIAGSAASGVAAYNMCTYQIMNEYLDFRNEEMQAKEGRDLTQEERNTLYDEFDSLAREYGLWEAVPEAISNLLFAQFLGGPLGSMLTRKFGKSIVKRIIGKVAAIYGEEMLTETVTQKMQSAIEAGVGMRERGATWGESFKEVFVSTFLLTTIMAGVGQTVISSTNAIQKARTSLKNEAKEKGISEDSDIYKQAEQEIEQKLSQPEEITRPEVTPEVTPAPEVTEKIIPPKERGRMVTSLQREMVGLQKLQKQEIDESEGLRGEAREKANQRIDVLQARIDKLAQASTDIDSGVVTPLVSEFFRDLKPVAPEVTPAPEVKEPLSHKEFIASGKTEAEWDIYAAEQNRLSRERGQQRTIELWQGEGVSGNDIANLLRTRGVTIPPSISQGLQHSDTVVSSTSVTGRGMNRTEASTIHKWVSEQLVKPAIPKAEVGMPEAGYQPAMIEGVTEREVRPPGKGRIVQISMEDQLKLEQARQAAEEAAPEVQEAYEAQAEIEGIKATHQADPVANYRFKMGNRNVGLESLISIREQSFPEYLTVKQAQALRPYDDWSYYTQKGTPQYNHIPRNNVLDTIAQELGYDYTGGIDAMVERVMQIRQEKATLREAEETIKRQMTEKPLEILPEPTETEQTEMALTPGNPKYSIKQINALVGFFAEYINNPSAVSAWELTRELRRETRAGRAENLKARAQELIVSKGLTAEGAMKQAITETLSGELPSVTTEYFEGLTNDLRDALFAKVYHALKGEPFEMASTVTALTNALTGRPIPREPGVKGGSAYARLQRVFGDQPKLLKAIDKIATEKKPLEDVVEGIYHEIGRDPIPIDQETADYLRGLSTDVIYEPTAFREPIPVTHYEAPIEDAIKQMPLFPRPAMDNVIQVLKEIGMLPVDIGNFLRANKASFDFSFWRQQAPLIAGHPITFARANIEAWKAMWSQKSAEASWVRITRDPLYQIYEEAERQKGDFLRPLELKKGTEQYKGTEEYGYHKGVERVLPKLTGKLPWVILSQRAFETGTNVHNWLIFKNYYNAMLRLSEQYASGQKTLKEGQVFDVTKEMVDFSKSLANFSGRGSLGKFQATAPELSGLFFAPRLAMGRILSVKDLINANPRVRLEAWKNAATFVGTFGGIVLLGAAMGWWEVETDPRSAEYMSIRIGNMRIDPWGGYRQFLVFFSRAITQTGVSSVTGAEYKTDPINLIQTFLRGKASPLASLILDFWRGKNFIGEEVDVANKRQWVERLAPFAVWDIYEAFTDAGTREGIIAILPAMVGAGVQTYTGDWKENWVKLGLPKYSDNLGYGLTEPKYDTVDFWSDTSSQFKGVDPATLTKEKGYPKYIKAIAEARIINEYLDTLPSEKLVSLNADPSKGTTFAQYYQMWRDREAIVASGDEEKLKEFDQDERTRNAYLGNFSQRQFALLNEYWSITDKKKQADFLKLHESEIGTNLRQDYLKSHPKENAQLAVWGQAKILTKEAYTEFNRLIKELDIPDSAISPLTLPPEGSVDAHFERIDIVDKWGANSWEDQLLRAKNPELNTWLKLGAIDTPLASLELKVKNRTNFDKLDAFSDKDSPDYIADDKARAEAIKKFRADNPEFVDDTRRIEAIEKGTDENPTDEKLVNAHVAYGKLIDQEGVGSSSAEAMLYRVDNPDYDAWRMDKDIQGDNALKEIDQSRIPIWRIDVKYRKEDAEYDAIPGTDREARDAYLAANEAYRKDRRRREAYHEGLTDWVEDYVAYYELPVKGYRQERFLFNNPDFALALGLQVPDRVPSEAYDDLLEKTDRTPEDDLRMAGYKLYVPDEHIENYVDYFTIVNQGKPEDYPDTIPFYEDDWWMMEHPDFYKEVYLGILGNQRKDYRKVPPTRALGRKWIVYNQIENNQAARDQYRLDNPDLDEWGVSVGIWTSTMSEKRRRLKQTETERWLEEWEEGMRELRKY